MLIYYLTLISTIYIKLLRIYSLTHKDCMFLDRSCYLPLSEPSEITDGNPPVRGTLPSTHYPIPKLGLHLHRSTVDLHETSPQKGTSLSFSISPENFPYLNSNATYVSAC